ncbi:MAG: glycosyltransferase, partial [Candidatus Eremiobacteraeota bacterium]|nr:glycosyltransferase [Candidatus Eremiobacteraeota bacterium]
MVIEQLQAPAVVERRRLISVIVPTLNEERYIGAVLDDMLAQRGIDADVEILVADGGSTDKTREIVAQYAARADVRLIDNPKRHQVSGYNLAIEQARGDIICITHAHARYPATYLADCWEVRERTGAANVGGVIRHRGEG